MTEETGQLVCYHSISKIIFISFDCSKAFDHVNYHTLFNELISRSLCPLACGLLIMFYSNIEGQERWKNNFSNDIQIRNGVKQGGVGPKRQWNIHLNIPLHARSLKSFIF